MFFFVTLLLELWNMQRVHVRGIPKISVSQLCNKYHDRDFLIRQVLIPPAIKNTTAPPMAKPSCLKRTEQKIHDVFLFSTEVDTLLVRLHELYNVVETFHIIESVIDFKGGAMKPIAKTLFDQPLFSHFLDKVKIHTVHKTQTGKHDIHSINWKHEKAAQTFGINIANSLEKHDLVIFGHVDEIPSRDTIARVKHCADIHFPLNIASWMPMRDFNFKFKTDYPVHRASPFTIGEPGIWKVGDVHGLARGHLRNWQFGGVHLTNYCHMPARLLKALTATEYKEKWNLRHKHNHKCYDDFMTQCRQWPRLQPVMGTEKFVFIPWLIAQNTNAFMSWYGKPDSRLDFDN